MGRSFAMGCNPTAGDSCTIDSPVCPCRMAQSIHNTSCQAARCFVRHAEGVRLRDLHFICDKPDARPALICLDTADLRVDGLELDKKVTADWLIELQDVREAVVRSTIPPRGTKTWARVAGAKSKVTHLLSDALRDVRNVVELGEGVAQNAVSLRPVSE